MEWNGILAGMLSYRENYLLVVYVGAHACAVLAEKMEEDCFVDGEVRIMAISADCLKLLCVVFANL